MLSTINYLRAVGEKIEINFLLRGTIYIVLIFQLNNFYIISIKN